MNEQYCALPITSDSSAAIDAIHAFADELVSHGSNCRVIFDALAADPDCALAQAYAAALFLTAMTREGRVQAAPRIAAARLFAPYVSQRERHTVEAIAAWGSGDDSRAIRLLRELVACWPHDLVAAKLCQVLELGHGDFAGMIRTSSMAASVDGRSGQALGLHAFALDQNGDPEVALRFARRAIELSPGRDPWAQHAAAHAMAALDQPVEGRAFLHAHANDWDRCSSFMLTHNWWHMALFSLSLGDEARALHVFDERVWGVRKGHCQDQVNAISLLARLEMAGVDADWRWADIAAHVEDRIGDRISGFLDLHYLYALARAGCDSGVDEMMGDLAARSSDALTVSLSRGLVAHARGEYQSAAHALAPARPHLAHIGGSNVQRELFEAMFAHSLRKIREPQYGRDRWRQAA